MQDIVIVSACRTAIGAFGGTLRDLNITDLARTVMTGAIQRAGIAPELIDEVRMGCNLESHDSLNVARVGALLAGIPDSATAATINRVCISGMEAVLSGMGSSHRDRAEKAMVPGKARGFVARTAVVRLMSAGHSTWEMWNSFSRTFTRPPGFHSAAVASSATAVKADPMPQARALIPIFRN